MEGFTSSGLCLPAAWGPQHGEDQRWDGLESRLSVVELDAWFKRCFPVCSQGPSEGTVARSATALEPAGQTWMDGQLPQPGIG